MVLQNKLAIVTGASSGMGKAIAARFVQEGAKVAGIARNEKALKEVSDALPKGNFLPIHADLSSSAERADIFPRAIADLGGIDVLVHAAGIIGNGTIETTSEDQWDYMMNINLTSIFHLTQLALPSLLERKGNIVSISSVTGLRAFPNVLAYCVSKAGLDQFTRCVALELAPKGVRVNAVNPGVVVTQLHRTAGMNEEQYAKFLEHSKTTHPLGRVGTPEDVADLVLFLASENASWITGGTYSIDGGRYLTCAR